VKSGAEAVALQCGLHALDRPGQPALQIVRQLAAERRVGGVADQAAVGGGRLLLAELGQ
jgi:hypothetical protein